jgi:hypothetical protein
MAEEVNLGEANTKTTTDGPTYVGFKSSRLKYQS